MPIIERLTYHSARMPKSAKRFMRQTSGRHGETKGDVGMAGEASDISEQHHAFEALGQPLTWDLAHVSGPEDYVDRMSNLQSLRLQMLLSLTLLPVFMTFSEL